MVEGKSAGSNRITDHDEIRNWVESHDGHPARVEGTGDGDGDDGGLLRIDLDEEDDDLERIERVLRHLRGKRPRVDLPGRTDEDEQSRFTELASREG